MRIHTNELGVDLGPAGRARLEAALARAFSEAAPRVHLVNVSLKRSEIHEATVTCVIAAHLVPSGRIVVALRAEGPARAIDRALAELRRELAPHRRAAARNPSAGANSSTQVKLRGELGRMAARSGFKMPVRTSSPGVRRMEKDRKGRRRAPAVAPAAAPPGAEALSARSDALAERVKELKCLHSIWRMLKGHDADLGDILQEVADVLPSACQYPDLACASITLKSRRYHTRNFYRPVCCYRAEITVGGRTVGALEVGYSDTLEDGREPALLDEERTLFRMVADYVSEIVALNEAKTQLSTYQEHLRSLAAELAMAEERERRTLAISLHDRIGQGLAVAKLKLETLQYLLPPEHHARLEDVTALIKEIVNDTRSLTFDISPPILYELGLTPAVVWLGEHVTRQFGLPVEVRCRAEGVVLNEGLRIMLFRSIQELLMNAVKHARASRASVRLFTQGVSEICALVEDDGVGFDPPSCTLHPSAASGFGLFSIRERIGHLGGRVEIESAPGKGTRVRLTVPGTRVKPSSGEAMR